MPDRLSVNIHTLLSIHKPAILVQIADARGSTPRDTDASMLVEAGGTTGTIGGGQAELMAIAAARAMLAAGQTHSTLDIPLGPEIGQCCGGHLALTLERISPALLDQVRHAEAAAAASNPPVFIYGAGHVGRALAMAVAPLPFDTKLVDSRAQEFTGLQAPGITQICTPDIIKQAQAAPPGTAHVVLTHSHALDSLIAATVLERGDFAYLGIIGSRTKRAVFERAFRETGVAAAQIARITCPIGGDGVRDKRPEVIAALVAAELIGVFAALKS